MRKSNRKAHISVSECEGGKGCGVGLSFLAPLPFSTPASSRSPFLMAEANRDRLSLVERCVFFAIGLVPFAETDACGELRVGTEFWVPNFSTFVSRSTPSSLDGFSSVDWSVVDVVA